MIVHEQHPDKAASICGMSYMHVLYSGGRETFQTADNAANCEHCAKERDRVLYISELHNFVNTMAKRFGVDPRPGADGMRGVVRSILAKAVE